MRVCWCTIHTEKLEASKKFYTEALGLKEDRCFYPAPGRTIVFLRAGNGSEIELIHAEGESIPEMDRRLSIGFEVEDLDKMAAHMPECGVEILRGPIPLGEGTRCFFVKDPNGVEIQIVGA